ncbi:Uncharacterized protein OS=Magnetococcus sp. (strain MC-1) GN=Mmc1_1231 PE=4 SV=1: DUF3102 [Gemmata massiliana]|uniref:DUF222 domain-containing protein n=1 Tax=Gemmata massiliana TaxID=1210884 RepID=A0A6P2D097_9BACT|nr:hypothetical protein [Gemmata massiliana]VTR94016.1 Uncharacterized protein OS=Magnetococcus sp. (strain MC-1) GN=Mmc1_1231 PE=4 SV=1: DUF3102 [Gemmata massiliana]
MGATAAGGTIYDRLTDADRQWLRGVAADLRTKLRHTVSQVLASGRLLADARKRLGRDRWKPWLVAEAQLSSRTAQRLVAVGNVFGHLSDSTILNFTPTALYQLAEPGVPQSIREYAVLQAQDGEEVTAAGVQEWLTAQRDTALNAPLKLATVDEKPQNKSVDAGEVSAEENWFILRDLIGADGTVHLSGFPDAENEDKCYTGAFIDGDGRRRVATGATIEAVVLQLADKVRKKVCVKCEENKPLDEFCRRSDLPDGGEYRCKVCERRRVKNHALRKAAAG